MQIPRGLGTSDPFQFKDGTMIMPPGTQFVPVENQEPHARQYNLAYENQREELEDLLQKVFQKKCIIWSLDKNWTKEGDCVVAVFYSKIVKKPVNTSSASITAVVGSISPEVVTKISEKEDELFDEFLKTMKHLKEEEEQFELSTTPEID